MLRKLSLVAIAAASLGAAALAPTSASAWGGYHGGWHGGWHGWGGPRVVIGGPAYYGGGYAYRDYRTGRMVTTRDNGDLVKQAPTRVQSRTTVVSRGGFGGGGRSFGG